MLNKNIIFEEKHINQEFGTTTYYFVAPKEMLLGKYPEAIAMEIAIEVLTNHENASVQFSPTKYDKETDGFVDYNWFDGNLSYEEINELLALANRNYHTQKASNFDLREVIHDKINEIFLAYQEAHGIESGDLSPYEAFKVMEIEDSIEVIIKHIYEKE